MGYCAQLREQVRYAVRNERKGYPVDPVHPCLLSFTKQYGGTDLKTCSAAKDLMGIFG
jgi:hypothetical protein